ncbi:MAG: hypothetical protein US57_C0002G0029 [Candidatus Moranbacteria bacterium GW2011_GWC2_37_73]|nr:MAG: hypothetical protein UR95_C0002G0127 [Parcubacteria group bacterium GW2011_GWC1_36_108]KKQ01030.1 MAG: hypothetical protein US09_C0003G0030 [Candidatus Moranbacteria bacterium GW2011_GWD1_36_198]KKQ02432.1 MAG: hypothetical protein US10_C0001G0030 [Candidatus Moranbacteria bacterium GW2011_GWD2_36_198]KKQ40322.1 MAG: hypothetical protein US57_C0002G0029 [Candidatus Moranbacteria bacterium GW2011_GWC2_37_73]HAS00289.1 hypothetical protein [Candidatus Moranbacteria bacterium]
MRPKMSTIARMLYQVYVATNGDPSLIRSIKECADIFKEDVTMNATGHYIQQLGEIFSDSKELQPQILLSTFITETLGKDIKLFVLQIQKSSLSQELRDAIVEELTQP